MARRRKTEQHRRCPATVRGADKQPVLTTNGDPFHLTLGHIVVDGQEARLRITDQCTPVIQCITDRLSHRALRHPNMARLRALSSPYARSWPPSSSPCTRRSRPPPRATQFRQSAEVPSTSA